METIDRKFVILAVNPCKEGTRFIRFAIVLIQWLARMLNANVRTEKDSFLFSAKDAAVLQALVTYRETCREKGCSPEHIKSIALCDLNERPLFAW